MKITLLLISIILLSACSNEPTLEEQEEWMKDQFADFIKSCTTEAAKEYRRVAGLGPKNAMRVGETYCNCLEPRFKSYFSDLFEKEKRKPTPTDANRFLRHPDTVIEAERCSRLAGSSI